jgi:S-adenosylmethionine/arginine decarboxylase-like enzyme
MVNNNNNYNNNNTHEISHPRPNAPPTEPYLVLVSRRFVILTLLSATLLAFALGQILRLVVLDTPRRARWIEQAQQQQEQDQHAFAATTTSEPDKVFSKATTTTTTTPPHTIYTLKQQQRQPVNVDATTPINDDDDDDDDNSSMGLHLLFDMDHVDSSFLNSEEQLVEAMKQLVTESNLTLLSYTCQGLEPFGGIDCVGVLLEFGHVSFTTWPNDGVMTLDLFFSSSGSKKSPMVSVIALAEELLARPALSLSSNDSSSIAPKQQQQQPTFQWARKYRGFKEQRAGGVDDVDLDTFAYLGSRVEYKQQVSLFFLGSLISITIFNFLTKLSLTLGTHTHI